MTVRSNIPSALCIPKFMNLCYTGQIIKDIFITFQEILENLKKLKYIFSNCDLQSSVVTVIFSFCTSFLDVYFYTFFRECFYVFFFLYFFLTIGSREWRVHETRRAGRRIQTSREFYRVTPLRLLALPCNFISRRPTPALSAKPSRIKMIVQRISLWERHVFTRSRDGGRYRASHVLIILQIGSENTSLSLSFCLSLSPERSEERYSSSRLYVFYA